MKDEISWVLKAADSITKKSKLGTNIVLLTGQIALLTTPTRLR
jgi:hypothetical protein